LVEVLIVVAILVVLAGVGGLTLMKFLEESKEKTAQVNIQTLEKAAKIYQTNNGGEPPPSLAVLAQPGADGGLPYLENSDVLYDPWNSPFQYDPNGSRNNGIKPDIWTVSPRGKTIGNWPMR
jgi:general secretion pathway protein G